MDSATRLRTLNFISHLHRFRSKISLAPPFLFPQPRTKTHYLSLSSSSSAPLPLHLPSERVQVNAVPHGAGEALPEAAPQNRILQVVLVSPQIPGNTGCIARTCAASAVGLHLVEPLGFQVDDTKLKRAGLDYWPPVSLSYYGINKMEILSGDDYLFAPRALIGILTNNIRYVVVKIHSSWGEFRNYFRQQEGDKRLLAFTKRGSLTHSEFSYRRGDWLVFGSETSGLPPEALFDCQNENLGGGAIRIPMVETYVRCLNLSVSVGIALYEASRQLNYEQLQLPSETCIDNPEALITEDIFA